MRGLQQQQQQELVFAARLDNVKTMSSMLSCLGSSSRKDQHCQVEVSPQGLVFIVLGRAKSTQAQANLQADVFAEYRCNVEVFRFGLNLTTLTECLQLLGPSTMTVTSATMSFNKEDAMFSLALEDAGVLTTCDIRTIYDEDINELSRLANAFRDAAEVCRAIVRSDVLKQAIADLSDVTDASTVRVRLSANRSSPHLVLSTGGSVDTCEIEFTRQSEAFIVFDCQVDVDCTYPLASLQQGMKALGVAKETFIRVNEDGLMCIQHQVESSSGHNTYVDFLMCPCEPLDDDFPDETPATNSSRRTS